MLTFFLILLLSFSASAEVIQLKDIGWIYGPNGLTAIRGGGNPIRELLLDNYVASHVAQSSSGSCKYGWWSEVLGVSYARDHGLDGTGVKVLVIDSGVDDNVLQEALGRKIDYHFNAAYEVYKDLCLGNLTINGIEYCYIDKYKLDSWRTEYVAIPLSPVDEIGHGTAVAATVLSVAPNVTLYSAKVNIDLIDIDDRGNVYIIQSLLDPLAIHWALAKAVYGPDGVPNTNDDVDVVNMSLGGVIYPLPSYLSVINLGDELLAWYIFKQPISENSNRVLFVASAGNSGDRVVSIPAIVEEVVGVSALEYYNGEWKLASFSTTGLGVDFASLGSGLYLPVPKDSLIARLITDGCGTEGNYTKWVRLDGTSFSSPLVAGIAALWKQYTNAEGNELFKILANHAMDVLSSGKDLESGYGVPIAPFYEPPNSSQVSSSVPSTPLAVFLYPLLRSIRNYMIRKIR
ncbi:hypothetical protein EYM_04085 [Ignicoccus islandicus DSM 13165]|uniref:Peptidase S8/S53 domain-containing protein n=1 Tax=Ignicoccus islandicus DSM 13165 TaxID=940295 RepID=A0A0U3FSJ2_9CREN|nr:hypothetical protein EYM_04085 [Ignicoccus islandicus DSM 13165]